MQAARQRGIAPAAGFKAFSGKGMTGEVAGRRVAFRNPLFVGELGLDPAPLQRDAEGLRHEGATKVFACSC